MTEFLIPETEDEIVNTKEECPYCDWSGKSLARHINHCKMNPENKTQSAKITIPDFNQILKFCEEHIIFKENGCVDKNKIEDYEIEQFYGHTISRNLYKKKYRRDRGGGGWSGAVKCTLNILKKMKKEGVLK